MIDNKATDMIKTVTDIIEEVKAEICDQYCKKLKELSMKTELCMRGKMPSQVGLEIV